MKLDEKRYALLPPPFKSLAMTLPADTYRFCLDVLVGMVCYKDIVSRTKESSDWFPFFYETQRSLVISKSLFDSKSIGGEKISSSNADTLIRPASLRVILRDKSILGNIVSINTWLVFVLFYAISPSLEISCHLTRGASSCYFTR